MEREKLNTLVKWIKEANSVIVLTGAGVSTESGIPDFRSQGGIYQDNNPFFRETLENDYQRFYDFCKKFFLEFRDCKANWAHKVLAKWESNGLLDTIITQNIDGLHQRAGSKKIIELHGTMETASCMECSREGAIDDFFAKETCSFCNGRLRPDIVLFGDPLPQENLSRAFELSQNADLYIVIGSSLEVMPANQLPFLSGGKRVLMNRDEVSQIDDFDLKIYGNAAEILKETDKIMDQS